MCGRGGLYALTVLVRAGVRTVIFCMDKDILHSAGHLLQLLTFFFLCKSPLISQAIA